MATHSISPDPKPESTSHRGNHRDSVSPCPTRSVWDRGPESSVVCRGALRRCGRAGRSEEHTSELQSRQYLVCRLLLEKKIRPDTADGIAHAAPGDQRPSLRWASVADTRRCPRSPWKSRTGSGLSVP